MREVIVRYKPAGSRKWSEYRVQADDLFEVLGLALEMVNGWLASTRGVAKLEWDQLGARQKVEVKSGKEEENE